MLLALVHEWPDFVYVNSEVGYSTCNDKLQHIKQV